MKKILLMALLVSSLAARGQESIIADTAKQEEETVFLPLIYADRKLTYLTLFQGLGNLPPLITEARFSGSYFVKKNARNWALELNLNLTLRIHDDYSFPIYTPSYNPVFTYYREMPEWDNSFMSRVLFDHAYWEVSAGHHSNGQNDPFYKEDSLGNATDEIDLKAGNFSVEYLEAGISTFKNRKRDDIDYISNLKLAFRFYPSKWYVPEVNDLYGVYRFFGTYNIYRIPLGKRNDNFFSRSRFRMHAGWIFGNMGGYSPADVSKRLISEVTYFYYPEWLAEISFFAKYYHGQDYYNVNFRRTLDVFQIGIASNPINFKDFSKYLKK
ncbi:hypothetical protein [Fulvivirga sediminis]|uniref:Uncharacterized protein n=1 Tax=Fulvivirga sediminis TaxID=2803949 RepID=A0A937F2P6_9BACT|nr:hypothetical protein [Fulvivirga sediminis]MBL3655217.1 hypothetical protein [Fulvivirga sediminis]